MITNQMHLPAAEQTALITAALLYDFGYLYVPQTVLDKGDDLTTADKDFIQLNLERGYETLRPDRGDYKFPVHTLDIIQQINKDGTTVLLVEQNAKKALSIANKAYVLETGTIALSGDAKELMNNDRVKKAYLSE